MNLSAPFIKRPVTTTLLMIALLLFGIFAYKALPVSDLPNIDSPTISVNASQPGGSPDYMANTVATPLERSLASISGLNTMTSTSTMGETTIVLNFDLNVDVTSKEVEVQAAITEALPNLPPMPTNPTFNKTNPSDTPILFIFLTSSTQTLAKLYEYGYDMIAQPLSMIHGVANVNVYGYPYAVRVQADPMKLATYQFDLNELAASLINANPNLPSGMLQGLYQNVTIETLGQVAVGEEYNKVVIKEAGGFPLRVENIGQAIDALEDRYPYFHYITPESDKSVVVLAVSRLPDSNTLSISEEIFKKLPDLKRSLPESVDLFIFYDYATVITASVRDVQFTLLIALLLVVGVIFFYLGKLFDTVIPSLVLPMAIVSTFILMYLLGFSLNNLSLLALTLAIGFIIDDAIVVQENIVRHVEMGKTPFQAAMEGSKQISTTIFTMTLALSSVFIPMVWMPGTLGKVFHEFALTIVIAILCSGFISLTLNPMLCSRFLKSREEEKESSTSLFADRMNSKLVHCYEYMLHHSIRYKKTTIFVGVLCLAASFFLLKLLPTDFIPPGNISLVEGLAQAAEGSSNRNTIEHQLKVNEIVKKNPYIDGFVSIAGYPMADQGIIYCHLVNPRKRPNSTTVAHKLATDLSEVPGMNVYTKPIPLINLQVGSTSSLGLYQYTLVSSNPKELYHYAEIMTQKIRSIPEIAGVNNDMKVKSPQLNITIDRDRAGRYGITAEEIETTLQYAYSGGRISTFNLGSNLYDLILEVTPGYDLTSQDLDLLYIKSKATGSLVPLSSLASWKEVTAPSVINHINIFPAVTISFGLAEGASLGTALDKIDRLASEILPKTVIGKVQGSAQVFIDTFEAMTYLVILALLVIYILLGILYESFIHPLTILSALPIAIFGGLLTLCVFRQSLSLYSVVGLIVLIGLMQKNGIMLIDFALEYLQKPGETAFDAILEACRARFRPIIMTTLAAMMGALPVAIGIGENGETNRPLGLVVVGGLLFSQLITLFVTPVVFLYMQELQDYLRLKWRKKGDTPQIAANNG